MYEQCISHSARRCGTPQSTHTEERSPHATPTGTARYGAVHCHRQETERTPRDDGERHRGLRLEASGYKITVVHSFTVHDALRLRVERHGKTQREIWKHCARLKVHF